MERLTFQQKLLAQALYAVAPETMPRTHNYDRLDLARAMALIKDTDAEMRVCDYWQGGKKEKITKIY